MYDDKRLKELTAAELRDIMWQDCDVCAVVRKTALRLTEEVAFMSHQLDLIGIGIEKGALRTSSVQKIVVRCSVCADTGKTLTRAGHALAEAACRLLPGSGVSPAVALTESEVPNG
jgi:hypothetical protein